MTSKKPSLPRHKDTYSSDRLGRVLALVLRLQSWLAVITGLCYWSFIASGYAFKPAFYPLSKILSLTWAVSYLIVLISWPLWLYKFHRDLRLLFPGYPISPVATIFWYFVPFYGLWGMLQCAHTLADHLSGRGPRTLLKYFTRPSSKGDSPLAYKVEMTFSAFMVFWLGTMLAAALGLANVWHLCLPTFVFLLHDFMFQLQISPQIFDATGAAVKYGCVLLFIIILRRIVDCGQAILRERALH